MQIAALVVALIGCVGIIGIGVRFLLSPSGATRGYGLAVDDVRGLTAIKGVRDVVSGIVLLVVLAVAGAPVLGWALVAAAITPISDAVIVLARRGKPATALGIHGVTAALLIGAGLVLALG